MFEAAFEAWLDGGAVGDPPAEPAASQQGVAEVRRTTRLVDGRAMLNIVGDDVPVEAWLLDGEEGGLDCTATDGPASRLFASGPMDFSDVRKVSDPIPDRLGRPSPASSSTPAAHGGTPASTTSSRSSTAGST